MVNDLQKSLHSQEEKLIAFAAQQREVSVVSICELFPSPLSSPLYILFSFPSLCDKVWMLLQAHCRTITTSRSFSQITGNFFKTLDMHVSQLGDIVEDAQTVSDQKFSELEKKFEVMMSVTRSFLNSKASLSLNEGQYAF